ncbi:adenine deaminase/adenosine deaminase [Aspergillus steynii IBT 23096]|uniref:Adenine deaminase/adenosine deaminase n=1 Tax=Aspergillus steynii IBT 23096 TaxID=1392250 RepID=A0A2I2GSI9_9EURO|nr:adenine deaminase/adenosine deaminase [Aspergillus steynii IBT 23096]PLB55843.1 adenine deaminase/adenosine deaminase [Aspergillus steynii IBT 23096]
MSHLSIPPFIRSLPKVELHIHIEGTLSPSLRWTLSQRNHIPLRYNTYESLLASYNVTYNHRREVHGDNGMPTFLETYFEALEVLVTEDDFYELAMAYFTRASEMNVRYAEPFFDLQAHTDRGVAVETVMRGLWRARTDAKEKLGVESWWILCFVRDRDVQEGVRVLREAMPWARSPASSTTGSGERKEVFHAVGVASNEYGRPPGLFEEGFRIAKNAGLKVTMHCDVDQYEVDAHLHDAVFTVCDGHGADRIDHGLNAVDSPKVMAGLKARGIGLTLCPHAYHRRQATEVLFPKIRALWDEGVTFCINSDDPAYMHDVWIDGNMAKMMQYGGFGEGEMVQMVRNAVEMSWAGDEVKRRLRMELDSLSY